jgi:hypothetical protein
MNRWTLRSTLLWLGLVSAILVVPRDAARADVDFNVGAPIGVQTAQPVVFAVSADPTGADVLQDQCQLSSQTWTWTATGDEGCTVSVDPATTTSDNTSVTFTAATVGAHHVTVACTITTLSTCGADTASGSTPVTIDATGPKHWDIGTPIGQTTDTAGNVVYNGQIVSPQDQTGPEPYPTIKCLPNKVFTCAVSGATDMDHWADGLNEGVEGDTVTYTWSCGGGAFIVGYNDDGTPKFASTFVGASAVWQSPDVGSISPATVICTIDDIPKPIAPGETGSRDDDAVVRTVNFLVGLRASSSEIRVFKNHHDDVTGQDSPDWGSEVDGLLTNGAVPTVGGKLWAVLDVNVGPMEKIDSTMGKVALRIQEDNAAMHPKLEDRHVDLLFDLTNPSGWLTPGDHGMWQPASQAPSTPNTGLSGLSYRTEVMWDTTGTSYGGQWRASMNVWDPRANNGAGGMVTANNRLMCHNEVHSLELASVQLDANTTTPTEITFDDISGAAYSDGPAAVAETIGNLVITGTDPPNPKPLILEADAAEDGSTDPVTFTATFTCCYLAPATATACIYTTDKTLVRSLPALSIHTSDGHVSFTWDGTADDGSALGPGPYLFTIAITTQGDATADKSNLLSMYDPSAPFELLSDDGANAVYQVPYAFTSQSQDCTGATSGEIDTYDYLADLYSTMALPAQDLTAGEDHLVTDTIPSPKVGGTYTFLNCLRVSSSLDRAHQGLWVLQHNKFARERCAIAFAHSQMKPQLKNFENDLFWPMGFKRMPPRSRWSGSFPVGCDDPKVKTLRDCFEDAAWAEGTAYNLVSVLMVDGHGDDTANVLCLRGEPSLGAAAGTQTDLVSNGAFWDSRWANWPCNQNCLLLNTVKPKDPTTGQTLLQLRGQPFLGTQLVIVVGCSMSGGKIGQEFPLLGAASVLTLGKPNEAALINGYFLGGCDDYTKQPYGVARPGFLSLLHMVDSKTGARYTVAAAAKQALEYANAYAAQVSVHNEDDDLSTDDAYTVFGNGSWQVCDAN